MKADPRKRTPPATHYVAQAKLFRRLADKIERASDAKSPRHRAARTRAINVLAREAKQLQHRNAFGDPDAGAFVDGALNLDVARINDLRAAAGRAAAGAPQDYRIDELEGPLLDLAVSKAIGLDAVIYLVPNAIKPFHECCVLDESGRLHYQYMPSRCWTNGGPLIEQHRIEVAPTYGEQDCGDPASGGWWAIRHAAQMHDAFGPTPLVAAMRTICKAHFGQTVRM